MKKIIAILLILSLLITAGCAKQSDAPEKSVKPEETAEAAPGIEQTALNLASDIAHGRYKEAAENYDYTVKMKEVISPEFYENDIGSVQDGFGEFTEMKTPLISQQDGYTIVSIPMVFTKNRINYNIVFDGENEIAGFNMGEYKESEETAAENSGISIVDTARSYAADLMEGSYEKAYTDYPHDAAMAGAVNADAYKDMIEAVKAQNGDFVKLGEIFTFGIDVYTAVDVPVEMTGENFNFEIYFDSQNRIAGLKFVPYQEKTETEMPDNIVETEFTADVNGHELGGTLTLPKEGGIFPWSSWCMAPGPTTATKPF